MKRMFLFGSLLFPSLLASAGQAPAAPATPVTPTVATSAAGTWKVSGDVQGVPVLMTCVLAIDGNQKITGTCTDSDTTNAHAVTGTAKVASLTWTYSSEYQGTPITVTMNGHVDDSTSKMDGTIEVDPFAADGTFSATKQAVTATQ
jgi:hypothetical protein